MDSPKIHEALTPISWLLGRWTTQNGHGSYPTIKDFSYCDILEFSSLGQPMFNYTSTSTHPEKLTPMHQERGFLRITPGTNDITFLVSHNFGVNSIEEGIYDDCNKEISLKSTSVSRISSAKSPHIKSFERKFKLLDDNSLELIVYMETDETPLTEHLKATYKKE